MNDHQARASTAGNVIPPHGAVTTVPAMARLAAAPKPWSQKGMKRGKVGCWGVDEKDGAFVHDDEEGPEEGCKQEERCGGRLSEDFFSTYAQVGECCSVG